MDLNFELDYAALENMGEAEPAGPAMAPVDPLPNHPYLTFPAGSVANRRCAKLRTMHVAGHAHIDWPFLESVGEAARARDIIGIETPWSRLFQIAAEDSFRELTVEFISSFFLRDRPEGYVEDPEHPFHEIYFRLAGQLHELSIEVSYLNYTSFTNI